MQNQYKGEVCLKWGGEGGRILQCPATDHGCLCAAPASDGSVSVGETPCCCSVPTKPSRMMVARYLKQVDSHSEYVEYKIFFLTRNYLEARQSRWV